MKCPNCNRRMVFDREIKDYYCDHCEKSLKDLDTPKKKEKVPITKEESMPVRPPDTGTVKGILFIMIGSVVNIISPFVCPSLAIISFFIFIIGFYLMYIDRKRHSKNHAANLKYAGILFVAVIIINILIMIYTFYLNSEINQQILDYEKDEIIPNSVFVNYLEITKNFIILSPLIISIMAISRYISIKELIESKFKKLLTVAVILILITSFFNMYLSLEYRDLEIGSIEETTRDQFDTTGVEFNQSKFNSNYPIAKQYLFFGFFIMHIAFEVLLILCYFWTYSYQRTEQLKITDML